MSPVKAGKKEQIRAEEKLRKARLQKLQKRTSEPEKPCTGTMPGKGGKNSLRETSQRKVWEARREKKRGISIGNMKHTEKKVSKENSVKGSKTQMTRKEKTKEKEKKGRRQFTEVARGEANKIIGGGKSTQGKEKIRSRGRISDERLWGELKGNCMCG